MSTLKNLKKRHWAGVVYPDSAPDNWIEILAQTGVKAAISPLHDSDKNPDGNPKKPHWHVILCFEGPTTFSSVSALMDRLHAPIPQALEAVRGYYRYLTHKDNPEKYQYDEKDIKCLNGFDIQDYAELTKSETDKLLRRVQEMVRTSEITEYAELMNLLADSEMWEMWTVSRQNTFFLTAYIKSQKFMRIEEKNNEKNSN